MAANASFRPLTRGTSNGNKSDAGTGTLTFNTPSDLMPGDWILVGVSCVNTGTIGQTGSGPTLALITNAAGSVNLTKLAVLGVQARAPATAGAGVSQDAGITMSVTNSNTTTSWAIRAAFLRRGHAVQATAFGDTATNNSATGQNFNSSPFSLTGATPGVDNGAILSILAYGSDANAPGAIAFPATLAISGGGTDPSPGNNISASTAAQKVRGVALYASTSSATSGAPAATRTCTMSTGVLGGMLGISISARPILGVAGDVLYGEEYKSTPDDATQQLYDIFYPPSGSKPSAGWPVCFWLHGGATGGNRYIDLTKTLVPQQIMSLGYCVVAVEWRDNVGAVGGADGTADRRTCYRYLRTNATALGLDSTKFVLAGSSAGATNGLIDVLTANVTSFKGASPENSSTSETMNRFLGFFPGSNLAFIEDWKAALGMASGPTCSTTSDIAKALGTGASGVNPCAATTNRWNVTNYPLNSQSQSTLDTEPLNRGDPAYWAQYHTVLNTTPIYLLHGTSDTTMPYKLTYHDGSGGRPPGVYNQLVAYGISAQYTQVTGADHGLNIAAWYPSAQAGATNGATVDAACLWLVTDTTSTIPRVSRRRRSTILHAS